MNGIVYIVSQVQDVLDAFVPLFITLALIYFIWGVAKYTTAKDEGSQKEAREVMIYGAIALFVIVSIWGLVALLQDFTNVDSGVQPILPEVPSQF